MKIDLSKWNLKAILLPLVEQLIQAIIVAPLLDDIEVALRKRYPQFFMANGTLRVGKTKVVDFLKAVFDCAYDVVRDELSK